MRPADISNSDAPDPAGTKPAPVPTQLRLYVARSTPNSVRAAANLSEALAALDQGLSRPSLEVIDVFADPKRAITDGIIVTPTLVGEGLGRRIVLMGDLSNRSHLAGALENLLG